MSDLTDLTDLTDLIPAAQSLERGFARAELEWIGEGHEGEYDPNDPDDCPLLRFSLYRIPEDDEGWQELENGSYCTVLPATLPACVQQRALQVILDEAAADLERGYGGKKTEALMSLEPTPDLLRALDDEPQAFPTHLLTLVATSPGLARMALEAVSPATLKHLTDVEWSILFNHANQDLKLTALGRLADPQIVRPPAYRPARPSPRRR